MLPECKPLRGSTNSEYQKYIDLQIELISGEADPSVIQFDDSKIEMIRNIRERKEMK